VPVYSRKKPVPTSFDLVDAIEQGDYARATQIQEERLAAGEKPVAQGTIERMLENRLKKQLGLP
jgi:hypothetical protein